MTDPVNDLKIAYELLAENGTLIIVVPHWQSWQKNVFKSNWFPLELPRHRTHFSQTGLTKALQKAGFKHLKLGKQTSALAFIWSVEYLFVKKLIKKRGLAWALWSTIGLIAWPVLKTIDFFLNSGDVVYAIAKK